MHGEFKFEDDSDKRLFLMFDSIVTYATNQLSKQANISAALDGDETPLSTAISNLTTEILMIEEMVIKQGNVHHLYSNLELLEEFKKYETVKFMVLMANATDNKICNIIDQMVDDQMVSTMVQNARDKPHLQPMVGENMEREFGITIASSSIITQIKRNQQEVTFETVNASIRELSEFQLILQKLVVDNYENNSYNLKNCTNT